MLGNQIALGHTVFIITIRRSYITRDQNKERTWIANFVIDCVTVITKLSYRTYPWRTKK